MGKRLMDFYDEAMKLGAAKAKLRLAMITCVSSSRAMEAPDSPENIKKFADAMTEIKKEFH